MLKVNLRRNLALNEGKFAVKEALFGSADSRSSEPSLGGNVGGGGVWAFGNHGTDLLHWKKQYPIWRSIGFGREAAAGGKWEAEGLLTERSLDKAVLRMHHQRHSKVLAPPLSSRPPVSNIK